MQVQVGCQFEYDCPHPMATVWQVRPRPDGPHRVVTEG